MHRMVPPWVSAILLIVLAGLVSLLVAILAVPSLARDDARAIRWVLVLLAFFGSCYALMVWR